MDSASSSGESGQVYRRGKKLVVVAPAALSRNAWLTLAQELQMFADATPSADHELILPVDRAAELRETLARPWPAGRVAWTWSVDAKRAASRASDIKVAVDRLLDDPTALSPADLDEHLSATGFVRHLLPAQRAAVSHLLASGGGGNFSVPGSGKTTMTYAVFALLCARGQIDRMLVIAPQSAYEAWVEEARDCFAPDSSPVVELAPVSPRRRTDVLVLNYERASMPAVRAAIDRWSQGHRFLVVFDEAHRAKRGSTGLHGQGALDLAGMADVRLVLTGTPMPNGPADLVNVLDLAWPGQGARLASRHTPHADRSWVRITKDQLELEDAEVVVEEVTLDPNHARIYDALSHRVLTSLDLLETHPDLGERAIMRLIACASNPMLILSALHDDGDLAWPENLPVDRSLAQLVERLGSGVRPAKLLVAARHAAAHARAGTKLLVWTNFIGNVRELERLLEPYGTATITGATPRSDVSAATDRERELRRFREDRDCTVLIATPQTLGEGVSLHHDCQAQLHVDRSFNAGLYLQAMDRTHRIGMPVGTRAKSTILVARGTIDERIDESLRAKLLSMELILKDPTLGRLARVDIDPSDNRLSPEALTGLLSHLRAS